MTSYAVAIWAYRQTRAAMTMSLLTFSFFVFYVLGSLLAGAAEGFRFLGAHRRLLALVLTRTALNFFSRITYENILPAMVLARNGDNRAVLGALPHFVKGPCARRDAQTLAVPLSPQKTRSQAARELQNSFPQSAERAERF